MLTDQYKIHYYPKPGGAYNAIFPKTEAERESALTEIIASGGRELTSDEIKDEEEAAEAEEQYYLKHGYDND